MTSITPSSSKSNPLSTSSTATTSSTKKKIFQRPSPKKINAASLEKAGKADLSKLKHVPQTLDLTAVAQSNTPSEQELFSSYYPHLSKLHYNSLKEVEVAIKNL